MAGKKTTEKGLPDPPGPIIQTHQSTLVGFSPELLALNATLKRPTEGMDDLAGTILARIDAPDFLETDSVRLWICTVG